MKVGRKKSGEEGRNEIRAGVGGKGGGSFSSPPAILHSQRVKNSSKMLKMNTFNFLRKGVYENKTKK